MLFLVNSLRPHHFPNGFLINFTPNVNCPREDLIYLEHRKASIITVNWMTNIMHDAANKKNGKTGEFKNDFKSNNLINYENLNIIAEINRLINEEQIHDYMLKKNNTFLLGWSPLGSHGKCEILSIIYCNIDNKEKKIKVNQLIQSPFWSPHAISSVNLKNSLEDLGESIDSYSVCFNKLYVKDLRYKLEWSTWNLTSEVDTAAVEITQGGEIPWSE